MSRRKYKWIDGGQGAGARFHRICRDLAKDLDHAPPSQAEAALIRQAAVSIVASEQLQKTVLEGQASAAQLAELSRLSNSVARLLRDLGLQRGARKTLDVYRYFATEEPAS